MRIEIVLGQFVQFVGCKFGGCVIFIVSFVQASDALFIGVIPMFSLEKSCIFIRQQNVLTWASRNVSLNRPETIWRNPVRINGRKTPVMTTWSPGCAWRVTSPRHIIVSERGMWPIGTWSLCSCILISWNLTNFEPRVCRYNRPPDLLTRQSSDGQSATGMNDSALTGWYVSAPQRSHVYVATTIIGFTSVQRVTIPRTATNFPMLSAFTSRMDTGFWRFEALNVTSLQYEEIRELKLEWFNW